MEERAGRAGAAQGTWGAEHVRSAGRAGRGARGPGPGESAIAQYGVTFNGARAARIGGVRRAGARKHVMHRSEGVELPEVSRARRFGVGGFAYVKARARYGE